jgi:hypothetical protein
VAKESRENGLLPVLALGLEAAPIAFDPQLKNETIALATGAYPTPARPAEPGSFDSVSPTASESWYEVLGWDAAVLASAALDKFPLARVDDARIVSELHKKARDALARAKVELRSTGHSGFAGGQQLPRNFRVLHSPRKSRR